MRFREGLNKGLTRGGSRYWNEIYFILLCWFFHFFMCFLFFVFSVVFFFCSFLFVSLFLLCFLFLLFFILLIFCFLLFFSTLGLDCFFLFFFVCFFNWGLGWVLFFCWFVFLVHLFFYRFIEVACKPYHNAIHFFYLCKVVSPKQTHMSSVRNQSSLININELLLRLCDLLVLKSVLECVILIKGLIPFFCLVGWKTPPKTRFFLIRL